MKIDSEFWLYKINYRLQKYLLVQILLKYFN